ncbi:MAG: DUF6766 family protein [Flavisolibacter sp.]|jgi:hypothetical protein
MKKFFRHNGLSIVFFVLFILTLIGQSVTGLKQYNNELKEHADQPVSYVDYLTTGHFFEATFENWESEFLQMALFVLLTMHLYQKGSSESKDPDKKEEVDKEPDPKKKDVPWPVKKGGIILSIYKYSLGYSLFLLFILSFVLHWYGSLLHYNKQQMLKHEPTETALQYIGNSRLWFESLENWQSEFLSVFAIVILSIYFRQKGSSQSKAVDAANSDTGG